MVFLAVHTSTSLNSTNSLSILTILLWNVPTGLNMLLCPISSLNAIGVMSLEEGSTSSLLPRSPNFTKPINQNLSLSTCHYSGPSQFMTCNGNLLLLYFPQALLHFSFLFFLLLFSFWPRNLLLQQIKDDTKLFHPSSPNNHTWFNNQHLYIYLALFLKATSPKKWQDPQGLKWKNDKWSAQFIGITTLLWRHGLAMKWW